MPRRKRQPEVRKGTAREEAEEGECAEAAAVRAMELALGPEVTEAELGALKPGKGMAGKDLLLAVGIKRLRKAAGLPQEALALVAGVTRQLVGQVEAGHHQPVWGTVAALCRAMGFPHWRLARWVDRLVALRPW